MSSLNWYTIVRQTLLTLQPARKCFLTPYRSWSYSGISVCHLFCFSPSLASYKLYKTYIGQCTLSPIYFFYFLFAFLVQYLIICAYNCQQNILLGAMSVFLYICTLQFFLKYFGYFCKSQGIPEHNDISMISWIIFILNPKSVYIKFFNNIH